MSGSSLIIPEQTIELLGPLVQEIKNQVLAELGPQQPKFAPYNYYSVQNSKGFLVPNKTWTVVTGWNIINSNAGGGASRIKDQGLPDFEIGHDGTYLMAAYVRWSYGRGQRLIQFIREYDTTRDSFGSDEVLATPGFTFHGHSYPVGLTKGRRIALRVFQDSGAPLRISFVQYKCALIQPR